MRNKKVLIVIPAEDRHKSIFQEAASGHDVTLVYKNAGDITETDDSDISAIIGNLPTNVLRNFSNLEWVQLNSAGAAEYAAPGILPDQCVLTNAAGAYGISVSEHMLAMTFALIRRFGQYGRNQAAHRWEAMGNIISVEGSTVAVLGLGDIGGSYAKKMKSLGAHVIGFRKNLREKPDWLDEQYTLDSLDDILPRTDFVAMVLPGVPETEKLMNEQRLARMKKGAFLINVGRGSAVDLNALKQSIASGHLGGAGLDVTDPEPLPADDALWDFDNVIITPHVAGNYFLQETFERIVRISAENLKAFLDGEDYSHIVSRKNGY